MAGSGGSIGALTVDYPCLEEGDDSKEALLANIRLVRSAMEYNKIIRMQQIEHLQESSFKRKIKEMYKMK